MYNEDQKQQFINEYAKTDAIETATKSTFDAIEEFEITWGSDICTQDEEPVKRVLDKIVGFRTRSALLRKRILGDYCEWCVRNNIPGAKNVIRNIEIDGLDKMRTQTVSSPLELQVYMDAVFESEDSNTIDNTYRAYYWLAFSGMREDDILKVKNQDIDFKNMIVKSGDRKYPIYRESINVLRYCIESDYFNYSHPNYSSTIERPRMYGDLLLRGIKAQPTSQGLRIAVSKRSRAALKQGTTDLKLSYYRVHLSGIFYRMYQRETAGMAVDFTEDAEMFMEGKEYSLDDTHNTYVEKRKQVMKDYETDYQRWKKVLLL